MGAKLVKIRYYNLLNGSNMAVEMMTDTLAAQESGAIDRSFVADDEDTASKAAIDIMLVEDDEADAFLIFDALSTNKRVRRVVRAHDGVEAIELIAGGLLPDLAIIDLNMPRKDGFQLLRDLRDGGGVDVTSVVLTSSRDSADSLRCLKRGALMFASKPKHADHYAPLLDRMIDAL